MKKQKDTLWRKRTQRDYSLAFKLGVVADVERGELTYKEAQKQFGIQGRSTVLVWLRKHGTLDWKGANPMKGKPSPGRQIRELEQQLKRLQADREILNRAIDLADKQLGTDIRKKYLALLSEASKELGSQADQQGPGADTKEEEDDSTASR